MTPKISAHFFHSPSSALTIAPGIQQVCNQCLLNKLKQLSIFIINIYFKAKKNKIFPNKAEESMYLNEILYFLQANLNSHFKFFHYREILNYNIYHSKIYEFNVYKLIAYKPLLLSITQIL